MIVDVGYYTRHGYEYTDDLLRLERALLRAERLVDVLAGGVLVNYGALPKMQLRFLRRAICAETESILSKGDRLSLSEIGGGEKFKLKVGDFSYENDTSTAASSSSGAAKAGASVVSPLCWSILSAAGLINPAITAGAGA